MLRAPLLQSTAVRHRFDAYFESVRDVERQLKMSHEWVNRPKPEPISNAPRDLADNAKQAAKFHVMVDMIHLALVTDSTRAISIRTFGMHHDLSHHGKEAKNLEAYFFAMSFRCHASRVCAVTRATISS
ncbi:MAG: hypothetical protein ACI9UA_002501 [Pseudoalteromonas tetraodonis]|jgi:hypothetical protein